MREMVLNQASLRAQDRAQVKDWLVDLIVGMGQLIHDKCVQASLRTSSPHEEICCLPDYSLSSAARVLQQSGARDQYLFFVRLTTKVPLLSDVSQEVVDRFCLCEMRKIQPEESEPLILCAIQNWIAVGFPSTGEWDRDQVVVSFHELLPDDGIQETSETIDNLTRSQHASLISARHRKRFHTRLSRESFWSNREEAFPHLVFGPDVENHILALQPSLFETVVNKLNQLDESAARWQKSGSRVPQWGCKVTTESRSVMTDERLREARRFQSHSGTTEIFKWHARFGSNGRIHLRFDSASRQVEIGYVGRHLPL